MRAVAALVLVLAAAWPAAAAADEREEYTPRSRPLPEGQVCPQGQIQARTFSTPGSGERCARRCRVGYALLSDFSRERLRCVPSRTSRLWYRAQLDVRFSGVFVTNSSSPGGSTQHTDKQTQEWRFTSSGAATVFRRCSALLPSSSPEHSKLVLQLPDDAGRMRCARVGRAVGAKLFDDTSFGFRGTIVAGPTTHRYEQETTKTFQWQIREPNGRLVPQPVTTTCTFSDIREHAGTGPRYRATVGALEQSARLGGTSVGLEGLEAKGAGTYRENAFSCPGPPGSVPSEIARAAKQQPAELRAIFGPDLADLFTPNLAGQFGRPRMRASQTVKRNAPAGKVSEATFTLELTRCPDRGRDPQAC
jgi:hypothetical protein